MPLDTGERLHRRRFREPDPQVELLGQGGMEVMALPLRLRAVDNADGALKPLALQVGNKRSITVSPQVQQELWDLRPGAQPLVAFLMGWADLLDLHWPIPVRSRRHRPSIR